MFLTVFAPSQKFFFAISSLVVNLAKNLINLVFRKLTFWLEFHPDQTHFSNLILYDFINHWLVLIYRYPTILCGMLGLLINDIFVMRPDYFNESVTLAFISHENIFIYKKKIFICEKWLLNCISEHLNVSKTFFSYLYQVIFLCRFTFVIKMIFYSF